MESFTFTYHSPGDASEGTPSDSVSKSFSGELTWPEVADRFTDFLRGVGYILPKMKTLGLVQR